MVGIKRCVHWRCHQSQVVTLFDAFFVPHHLRYKWQVKVQWEKGGSRDT